VTGFGLLGHTWEMATRSGVTVRIDADRMPVYDGARAAAAAGVRTGGDARNRAYLDGNVTVALADPDLEALAYDPQTSGGLLAAVPPGAAADLTSVGWWEVGEVVAGPPAVTLA
jgi:selenide,water dikinase